MKTEIVLEGKDITQSNWEILKQGLIQYVEESASTLLISYKVKLEDRTIDALSHPESGNPIGLYVQSITDVYANEFFIMFDPAVLEFALYEILHYASESDIEEEFKQGLELLKANFEANHDSTWIHHSYKTFPAVGPID